MMVLCSNDSSRAFIKLCHENPNKLGQLIGPASFKRPKQGVSFALDNDAYTHFMHGREFDTAAWLKMLDKMRTLSAKPMWVAVPDVVADRRETLRRWAKCAPVASCYGWPLAFVVQDGMTKKDVPDSASVVFIGGSTSWKWRTLPMWVSEFPRIHLGRCGTSREKLDRLESLGIESCDGSGFFRATIGGREARQLLGWLHKTDHQQDFVYV